MSAPDDGALRVATFPPRSAGGGNPYQRLFEEALARHRVEQVDSPPRLTAAWVREAAGHVDAVHLHWLEFLFLRSAPRGLRRPASALAGRTVVGALDALRESPVRVVWTLHNLRPHEGHLPRTFDRVRDAAVGAADVILCHSDDAVERTQEALDRRTGVVRIPHGNYDHAYPAARRSREEVRAELGVAPDAFLAIMFGLIRPYKQVPEAIAAFGAFADPDARLLVAGRVRGEALEAEVRAAAQGDPRVLLDLANVPDERIAELLGAGDALVLNHRDLFSSGALVLGLTYGLPIVAPSSGTVSEVAPELASETFAPGEMAQALARVRERRDERRAAALEAAARCDWDEVAATTVAAYRGAPG